MYEQLIFMRQQLNIIMTGGKYTLNIILNLRRTSPRERAVCLCIPANKLQTKTRELLANTTLHEIHTTYWNSINRDNFRYVTDITNK